jgi:hypothetical protein
MHIEKLAWAVSLMNGAKRIVAGDGSATIHTIGTPVYLLIGFSIENALKSYLVSRGNADRKMQLSHDLAFLLEKAKDAGLNLPPRLGEFVREVSTYHADFVFRYPEKAGWASLWKPAYAVEATEAILTLVTTTMDPVEILGWAPSPKDFER